ncbi:ferredoxin [Nocardioides aromaticivorans]|uniref:Ferredoxin n=1 Tax=Nocardioides aromaticivorans TaxID=200618 RepID=A0A7Z0CK84_9ACTN|nr:ferredoxin [Nocardioides aromaticivorans]NYI44476.1 ferredoxin [Nocardioides aromaticivorans]
MRIHVEYDRCEGHGLCAEQAPQLFSLDDDAELTYHAEGSDVPADQQAPARAAIASCPVAALRETS